MSDPAPTPWKVTGSSIVDADGHLVVVLAQRLMQQRHIIAALARAPEMFDMLQAVEGWMRTQPEPALLNQIRAVLDRASGDRE